ncbi:MAG TPA: hypothetical protein ENN43_06770, partial [bacterium]|nr:hypothetical protein [bacterium]
MLNRAAAPLLARVSFLFALAASAAVFWQPSNDPFGPVQAMALIIFLPFSALVYFVFCAKGNERVPFKMSPVLFPVALYLAAALISVFFSINKTVSFKYFAELFIIIAGAFYIYSVFASREQGRIAALIIASHTLMALYAVFQNFGADPFRWNTDFGGRPMGTIGNPNFFAAQLLISIFMTAGYLFFGARMRLLLAAALFVQLLAFWYSMVLGAFIGLGAGAALFLVMLAARHREKIKSIFGSRKLVLAAAVAAVIAAGLLLPPAVQKIKQTGEDKKRSIEHRFLMWEVSLLMIKDAPVLGKGIGSYRFNYPHYQGILLNKPGNEGRDYVVTWMPHQNYLLIAAEKGIIGLGLFLLAVAVFYYRAFRREVFSGAGPAAFEAGAAAAVTALLGASFFN